MTPSDTRPNVPGSPLAFRWATIDRCDKPARFAPDQLHGPPCGALLAMTGYSVPGGRFVLLRWCPVCDGRP